MIMAHEPGQKSEVIEESRRPEGEEREQQHHRHRGREQGRHETGEPVILDFGSRSKREVDRLRHGRGDLMDEVEDAVEELIGAGQISASAQPVIIVVKERVKRKKWMPLMVPPGLPFGMMEEEEDDEDDEDEDED
jgi:hypothetical protein